MNRGEVKSMGSLVPLEAFDFSTALSSLSTAMTTNIGLAITAGVGVAAVVWGVRVGLRVFKSVAK